MNFDRLNEKLEILADAAKYDVSCASSGGNRKNKNGGLGNSAASGICHSYTEDGRCISLLKILLTNHCIFDCAYCVSRKSNDVKRAAFTVGEVVELTMSFYRRNYIEGLFLSSGIFKDADTTMERLVRVAKKLRQEHKFFGYIHLKTIPGASDEILKDPWGNTKSGFSFEGKIKRSDFGLNWNAALETGGVLVSDDVKVFGELQFVKA